MRLDKAVWFIISGGCWVSLQRCSRKVMTSCCVSMLFYSWNPFLCLTIFFKFLSFMPNRTTAESLSNQNEADLQRRFQERQQEIDQMQQVLETKIQLLQEVCPAHDLDSVESGTSEMMTSSSSSSSSSIRFQEAQLARSEAERMASLAGSQSHASLLSLDTPMEDVPEDERSPRILSSPTTTTKDRWAKWREIKERHITSFKLSKSISASHWLTVRLCSGW